MLDGAGNFQNVVLFGGNSDIGQAILRKLPLALTGNLILVGRNLIRNDLQAKFPNANLDLVDFNFESTNQIDELVSKIFLRKDIDLAIVAYGYLGKHGTDSLLSETAKQITINYFSPAILFGNLFKAFHQQKHGKILIISSVAGIRPRNSNFVYGSAKSGLDFLVRGSQDELSKNNVSVTILRPGFVYSKMTKGMKSVPFSTTVDKVAVDATRGMLRKKKIVYSPNILKYVFVILRILPSWIFRKLQ